MSAEEYAIQVVENFITDITDHVFLSIERNDSLMREYMSNVNRYGLDAVNTSIGKKVRELLNLDNKLLSSGKVDENNNPQSRLIKSYTRHERKKDTQGQ